jgi:16S rRNA (uracil1498-N3)-methyltransferase
MVCPRKNIEGGGSIPPAIIERMVPRFLAPSIEPGCEVVTLPQEEGTHLARVLRLRAGDPIRVFDGRGHEFLARVLEAGGRRVRVKLGEAAVPAPESPLDLTIAQAVLTGDKMDNVVRDLTMLAVTALRPVVSRRAALGVASLSRSRRVDRWRRIAVASAKQCGRAVLPRIDEPLELQDWLRSDTSGLRLILVEPAGQASVRGRSHWKPGGDRPQTCVSLLVGPEGGWTAEEAAMADRAGFVPWTLGGRTLRAEAAPVVAASILQHVWGDLD